MTLKNFYKLQINRHIVKCTDRRRSGVISPLVDAKRDEEFSENGVKFQKSKEEENTIYQALTQNEFLNNILLEMPLEKLIDSMYLKSVYDGDILLRQGNPSSNLFVSNSGTFEILEKEKFIGKFQGVRVFGEVAILHSTKACQTIKAVTTGSVWILDCSHFKSLTVNSHMKKQDQIISYLKNVPELKIASEEKLYALIDLFKEKFYHGSSLIVREGDIVDCFVIITAGSASILSREKNVEKLHKADFFGEKIFLKETLSLTTIVADPPGVQCLILSRQDFTDHFTDWENFLRGKTYLDTDNTDEYSSLDLKSLRKLKTLGVGGFGRVELVQNSKNKDQVFALKCLKKFEIVGQSQINQVFNEKILQISCNNPFIVKLYRTFRDTKYIYFLLEPCMGGDLWNMLRRQRKKCFDTDAAKFYAGCILEAFSYLHSRDIIYRDLKPENVMVSSNGYLKLTDFGFAKKLAPNEKTYSFVGTAEYVSPELIQNLPHDKGVDYWALGVFIFELLLGKSPFRNEEHSDLKTYKAILRGIDFVTFPYIISPRARNLIKKLCRPLSIDRIGCQKNGARDVQSHPWFSKFDWEKLRDYELEPPIRIFLHGKTDSRYFEGFKDDKNVPVDDFSTWDENF